MLEGHFVNSYSCLANNQFNGLGMGNFEPEFLTRDDAYVRGRKWYKCIYDAKHIVIKEDKIFESGWYLKKKSAKEDISEQVVKYLKENGLFLKRREKDEILILPCYGN